MSDLRIRSEAVVPDLYPQSFLPPPARFDAGMDDYDHDFAPLIAGAVVALGQMFGLPVVVTEGRAPKPVGDAPVPRVAAVLASALATLQLGGDLDRMPAGGSAAPRQARVLAAVLDSVAERYWPQGCRLPGVDLDIVVAGITGHAHVPPPVDAATPAPPPVPVAALAQCVFELPMRVRVELATGMTPVSALGALRCGTVLPIDPSREMPLIMGDHRIGRVTLVPLPDGRQQAEVVAVAVEMLGGMS
ncbi:MAG: hypothetical protein ACOYLS_07775 [Polymorphobacter sp.]